MSGFFANDGGQLASSVAAATVVIGLALLFSSSLASTVKDFKASESSGSGSRDAQDRLDAKLFKKLGGLLLTLWFSATVAISLAVWAIGGRSGEVGDAAGLVNSFFSSVSTIGVVIAILMQRKELELQREELADTRKELQGSREAHQLSATIQKEHLQLVKDQQAREDRVALRAANSARIAELQETKERCAKIQALAEALSADMEMRKPADAINSHKQRLRELLNSVKVSFPGDRRLEMDCTNIEQGLKRFEQWSDQGTQTISQVGGHRQIEHKLRSIAHEMRDRVRLRQREESDLREKSRKLLEIDQA